VELYAGQNAYVLRFLLEDFCSTNSHTVQCWIPLRNLFFSSKTNRQVREVSEQWAHLWNFIDSITSEVPLEKTIARLDLSQRDTSMIPFDRHHLRDMLLRPLSTEHAHPNLKLELSAQSCS
jgi:hypothetical protein